MNTRSTAALIFLMPVIALAQVPVDDNGNVIGQYESQADIMSIGDNGTPLLSSAELQDMVGPIALYPDDLLAIVLPASAYPLQIVEAARFLTALESDPSLTPDEGWDDSVVALLNYPEVVELLNEDLDWTLRLGEAVVAQQADVVAAVEAFRDRAYAAGNLKSDEYQKVADVDGVISISPTSEDVIYVPYYEPARVVYYQPQPVYYYYPRAYPVYYYPYPENYHFNRGFFWGVTTAFTIGWYTDSLNVYHPSYYGHPYYGRSYWNHWYYRRPSISVYNTHYVNNVHGNNARRSHGDTWHVQDSRRKYVRREGYSRHERRDGERGLRQVSDSGPRVPVSFRERDSQQLRRDTNAGARTSRDVSGGTIRSERVATLRSGDDRRQQNVATARGTQRQQTVTEARSTPQRATQRRTTVTPTRDTQRRATVAPTRNTQPRTTVTPTRNTQPRTTVAPTRNTQPRTTVAPTRNTARQETTRQTYQQAPARTVRAPAPQKQRAAVPQPRTQPSHSSPPRSQERSNNSSSRRSEKSGNREQKSRSANRER